MKLENVIKAAHDLSSPYRINHGKDFRLDAIDPKDKGSFSEDLKEAASDALADGVKGLSKLQEMLYAHDRYALLLIFQAMDAAGKDGAIKHVMSGVNPQGCQVASFRAPTAIDLDHDYMWRCNIQLPERGRIGIFNRSYYEEVLIVKVHPKILDSQKIPDPLKDKKIWEKRYEDIVGYENYLTNNGVVILKFFLHVSKEEQKNRFIKRIEDPAKNWKFSEGDVAERKHWDKYMEAYEEMVQHTSTKNAPWYVVPADHKWYTRLVVASAIISALSALDLSYPVMNTEKIADLEKARKELESEDGK